VTEQEAQMEAEVAPELSTQEIENKFPILIGSTDTMIQKLKEVDPIMADRWHPNDRRKIRRSLEIFLLTGRKASEVYGIQKENRLLRQNTTLPTDKELSPESKQLKSTLLFWIYSEPEVLKNRLDNRVDKMMDSGLLAEVKSMNVFLQAKLKDEVEVDQGRGIWVSIGWKEFVPYLAALESGSESPNHVEELLSQSIERVKSATRQYAQRQNRWIRRKLIAALSEQNSLNSLYLLDGTNQDDWSNSVLKPALELTESFLTGQQLQKPSEMSSSAKRLLNPELPNESPDPSTRRECDLCHTIVVTEEQWQSHLKSRTHRRMVKKEKMGIVHERPAPGDGNDSATAGSN
jgi:tRNA dimethylallyltransferase